MFILMGGLASRCGLSRDLFRGANAWLGRFRGGIAMAAVAACGGFGAVCGSSTATASTMGQVALPELQPLPLLAVARHRHARRRRHARHPDPALGRADRLRHHRRGEHRHPVRRRADSRPPRHRSSSSHGRDLRAPGARASGPKGEPVGPRRVHGGDARPSSRSLVDLRHRHRRHLRRHLQPDAGRGDRRVPGRRSTASPAAADRWPRHRRGAARDGAHQRHDLPDPARRRAPEDLHGARRRAAGDRGDCCSDSGLAAAGVMALIILIFIVLGCLMDSLSMIILAIPFFWPMVSGARLRPARRRPEDLVRHHRADRGRARPDHAAGRPQRLHHQLARAGRADARDLQGRDAVLPVRDGAGDAAGRGVPGDLAVPAAAARRLRSRAQRSCAGSRGN